MQKKINTYFLIAIYLIIPPLSVHGEVIFDGTMNSQTAGQTLSGEFEINESQGQLSGKNLFHSFSLFNINADEKATFTGSNDIANIITRVTGNNESVIHGTLQSDINNANFYLLNPSGIFFGSNAKFYSVIIQLDPVSY